MPELAFGFAVGILASLLLMALHIFLFQRLVSSDKAKTLQRNLSKVQSYWAFRESKIKDTLENASERDSSRYIRDAIIIGGICSFFSWFGFLLQLIVMFSIRYLTKNRMENIVWNSDLVKMDLEEDQIKKIISDND